MLKLLSKILFMKKLVGSLVLLCWLFFPDVLILSRKLQLLKMAVAHLVNSLDMGKMLGLAKTMGSGKDEMKDI